MPVFHYKAASAGGDVLEGQMQASSQEAVIRQLHALGHVPIRADEIGSPTPARTSRALFQRSRVTRRDITEFTLELATLLEAGMPLDKALEMLAQLADKKAKRELLSRLHSAVREGAYLSVALESGERLFSPFYRNMVKAGEAAGALDAALERLADFMERAREMRDSVVSALIYPVILVLVGCVSMAIILGFVIPRIAKMFDQADQALPWFTQVVVATGEFVQHYGWVLAILIVSMFLYARRLLADPAIRLRFDGWFLGLPLVSDLVSKLETARFTRTLGTLLGGGVPMLDALAIARQVIANQFIAKGIDKVAERVRQGEGLARPLQDSGVFPRLAGHLLQVGEETGNLEKMLVRLAEIHEREVQTVLRRLMAVLEPLLIVGLAVVIAGLILSVVVPIFSINDLAF